MTSSPLSMIHYFGTLVEIHAIRRCHLSIVGWNLDSNFTEPDIDRHFYWLERLFILSPTPGVIFMLPFILLPSTFSKCNGWWVQCQFNTSKNCWSILFWYSYRQACWNILDTVFCDLHMLLQWEYKLFIVLLDIHTPLSFERISSLKSSFPLWIPL